MSLWDKLWKLVRPRANGDLPPSSGNDAAVEPTPTRSEDDGFEVQALDLEISLQSDMGIVRANNEDRGIYQHPSDPEIAARKGTLILVADGMGGASAGEVASEMAVRIIPDLYYNSPKAPALALKEALEEASSEIHRAAQSDPELRGMGTTCVAMAVIPPEAFVAYVGDSRLYLLRDGSFYQLTEDHTVVGELVRNGMITRDQARNHEERNVLSLSLGGRPEITASFWDKPMIVRAGDRFLACTDGLHDLVSDAEMQAIIADAPPDAAVHNLIEAAKGHGGHDNITAALIQVRSKNVESDTVAKPTRELLISPE